MTGPKLLCPEGIFPFRTVATSHRACSQCSDNVESKWGEHCPSFDAIYFICAEFILCLGKRRSK